MASVEREKRHGRRASSRAAAPSLAAAFPLTHPHSRTATHTLNPGGEGLKGAAIAPPKPERLSLFDVGRAARALFLFSQPCAVPSRDLMTTSASLRSAASSTSRPCRKPVHAPSPVLRAGLAPAGRRVSSSTGGPTPAPLRAPPGRRPASAGGDNSDRQSEPDALVAAAAPLTPSLDGEIARLLLPALAAVFLEPAMQVVDTALVGGKLGTAALAALGLSNLVYFFATVLFSFLLVVTTPAVAAAEAKGDRAGASQATARGLWVALGAGLIVGAGLWLAGPTLLSALAPGPDVAAAAAPHLRARALAAPATLALFVANGAFRGHRDTATPLAAGAAQNGVHLALDVALLTRPGAALPWAAGAAAVGACVGAAAMVGSLLARGLLRPADLARPPPLGAALELLKPGAPLAACVGAVAAAVLGAANAASALGAAALAAHTVIKQVVDFALAVFGTFSTVSQTMVAAALGAGDRPRARAALVRLLQLGGGLGVAVASAVLGGAAWLPSAFTSDPAVSAAAAAVLPVVALLMPLAPCGSAMEGALFGSMRVAWVGGRTVGACLISLATLALSSRFGGGLVGVWVASAALLFANAAADAWLLSSPRWSPVLVSADEEEEKGGVKDE